MGCNQSQDIASAQPPLPLPPTPQAAPQPSHIHQAPAPSSHPQVQRTHMVPNGNGVQQQRQERGILQGQRKKTSMLQGELQKFVDEIFEKYDMNCNGRLNLVQFGKLLRENADQRMSATQIKELIKVADGDADKSVDKRQLLTLYRTLLKY